MLALEHVAEFDAGELELLLCGYPTIDMADWQRNVEYRSGYSATHVAIDAFWQVVSEFSEENKAKLLRFVTGTSALPAVSDSTIRRYLVIACRAASVADP